jgi:hypothetical protein
VTVVVKRPSPTTDRKPASKLVTCEYGEPISQGGSCLVVATTAALHNVRLTALSDLNPMPAEITGTNAGKAS